MLVHKGHEFMFMSKLSLPYICHRAVHRIPSQRSNFIFRIFNPFQYIFCHVWELKIPLPTIFEVEVLSLDENDFLDLYKLSYCVLGWPICDCMLSLPHTLTILGYDFISIQNLEVLASLSFANKPFKSSRLF